MSKRDWALFLRDMPESIGNIEQYTMGTSFQEFLQNRRARDAVVRNLEGLGETAKRIPAEIPWAQIEIIQNKLLLLQQKLEQIAQEVSV